MKFPIFLVIFFFFSNMSQAGVSDTQRHIIDNQLFLLKEGLINENDVFKKAKKFDKTGIFGIGSDQMTREEFKKYLKEKSFTIHD